eukprot:CAMPEP_0194246612 /NCGR_PEP_ID=MMETSP0158-20130606/15280_1 /TAXON_ID=33649 /ORGANISM="Thalassionema nitzschioides, Strain L26-B" /LENGTH=379 /DNA_ID=CAMNT_0038982553 /DNA_START=67 /DNA_END=1203 /DNA_ORIENTATION=-
MVLIKRRSSSLSVSESTATKGGAAAVSRRATASIAFGNEHFSNSDCWEPKSSSGRNCPESLTSFENKFSLDETKHGSFFSRLPRSVYNILGIMFIMSWIAAFIASKGTFENLDEVEMNEMKYNNIVEDFHAAEYSRPFLPRNLDHLIQTRQDESQISVERNNIGENNSHHGPIKDWLDKRQLKPHGKVEKLKDFIQEESRQEAIKKFGTGPHYVKFTVEFPEDNSTGDFVVELASLDLMPHAVNTFLGQVSQRLWDSTVFWHHDGVDHVMAAAGINYKNGETKHHYFDALGVGALSFGEYSAEVPHKEFTLAFQGRGPEFYINAIDNVELHGPGGQGHHELSDEADPCFGKIISGLDIIHRMKQIQEKKSKEAEQRREW